MRAKDRFVWASRRTLSHSRSYGESEAQTQAKLAEIQRRGSEQARYAASATLKGRKHTVKFPVQERPTTCLSYCNQRGELRWRHVKCSQIAYIFRFPIVIHRADYDAISINWAFLVPKTLLYVQGLW